MNMPHWLPFLLAALLMGCQPKKQHLHYGKDQCHYCKMTLADRKFGAELVTPKGRAYKYDAIECMVNHLREDSPAYEALYVVPYDNPGHLAPVDSVAFLMSPRIKSPMGANLAAFADSSSLGGYQARPLRFKEVMKTME